MAKHMQATVEMADGSEYTVRILPVDVVAFERHYGIGVAKLEAAGDLLTEHAMYMAWHALARTGQWSGDLESFIEQVASVEDEAEAPVPSHPAP